MRGIYAAIVLSAVAGCSLVYASDLADARTGDGPVDGSAPEKQEAGSVIAEGGARDATAVSVDASVMGCAGIAPTPKFCDDFDSETNVDDGFSVNASSGETTFDTSNFVSAPRSAKVTFSSKGCGYSRLDKDFESVGSNEVAVHFRVRPSSPWSGQILFVTGLDTTGDDGCQFLLYANDDNGPGAITSMGVNIQQNINGNVNDNEKLNGITPVDTWTAVDIVQMKIMSGGVHYHVVFTPDGQAPIVTELDATQCPAWVAANLNVGIHCGSGKATVNYDDVWVDWK